MKTPAKPVILLVAEAVTLAHFARIAVLARSLDPSEYEVVVASDPRYLALESLSGCAFRPIWSIPSAAFERALARGERLYSAETLARYVEEDLVLLDDVKPDLVVGDFRLSLAVSAPLRNVPYASMVNAYWSPFAGTEYPVPDLPITRFLGVGIAQAIFDTARPVIFALHARPLNQVRRRYGLPPLQPDLRNVYTWGNYTLYADIPEIVPTRALPSHHYYLGPVFWSTCTPLPAWWTHLPPDRPVVFMTLGSSGQAGLLPSVLVTLSRLPITIIVATAGKIVIADPPSNAFIIDYLSIESASRRSRLIISNGGSLTTYWALAHGVPVIGLCSNMDQLLNMKAVERSGSGIALRATRNCLADLDKTVTEVLENTTYAEAAGRISRILAQTDASRRFRAITAEILHGKRHGA
ncbi:nucleotide disphospho-sugar-binding domain-containing protein [Nitrosovibrio sp. Nv17]|uniref:glycosyltransferase n=1 Tax=Nitrosovibrio sp. Nv17 TaxID=1855339 RepID=UPI000908ACE8|nr:nucleotide disphospho-sugar-binding domain-containing protein [Nitrosovibrio sp. Nv17]SFW11293.1 UDP:flavonoid glycosyltransferase YjiC, YdhE family [Nitrosovibrio sp. Nv17]